MPPISPWNPKLCTEEPPSRTRPTDGVEVARLELGGSTASLDALACFSEGKVPTRKQCMATGQSDDVRGV